VVDDVAITYRQRSARQTARHSYKRASGIDRAFTNRGFKDRQSADLYANVCKGVQHSGISTIRTAVKVG
jgi:hypothetical protein